MTSANVLSIAYAAAVISICACGKTDAPKMPLSAPGSQTSATDATGEAAFSREAKRALDSGNALFRSKSYSAALAQYNLSAKLAPAEISPLLGIMMVAGATNDAELSAATRMRIHTIDPAFADSSSTMSHSKMVEAHRRAGVRSP